MTMVRDYSWTRRPRGPRRRPTSFSEKPCAGCGEAFAPTSGAQKVCPACRAKTVPCQCGCGKAVKAFHYGSANKGFAPGCAHRGERNRLWKGGKKQATGKYVMAYAPDHPRNYRGYVYEHRLVAESMLGRYLRPDEHVHHVNGVKDDNRPENLLVMSNSEHRKLHHELGWGFTPPPRRTKKV